MTDIIINPDSINEIFDGTSGDDHFEDHDVQDQDVFNGGEGVDTVYYDYAQPVFSTSGKEVVLYFDLSGKTPDQHSGYGSYNGEDYLELSDYFLYVVKDQYNSIENLWGTDQSDHIHGNDANNEFYGFGGNDKIYGYGGDDRIFGGDGDDYIDGGSGITILMVVLVMTGSKGMVTFMAVMVMISFITFGLPMPMQ